MVRIKGLEPSRIAALEPKSSVSTKFHHIRLKMEPLVGFEPTTYGLQNHCSTK